MKKKLSLLLYFTFLFFVACNNSDETFDPNQESLPDVGNLINLSSAEYISIAFDDPKELDETLAFSIAQNFVLAKNNEDIANVSTKGLSPSLKLKSKYYAGLEHEDSKVQVKSTSSTSRLSNIPIYEFEIAQGINNGLIVVSGDERAPQVIGYVPNYTENEEEAATLNYFLDISKSSLINNISLVEHIRDSLRMSTVNKISKELGVNPEQLNFEDVKNNLAVDNEPLSKVNPIQVPPTQVISFVASMCPTQWNQTAPYNNKLPIGYVSGYSGKTNYYAGCGVIAVAQIVASFEPSVLLENNTWVNWKYLKQTPAITIYDSSQKKDMMGYFIKKIYKQTGAYPIYSSGYLTGVGTSEANLLKVLRYYFACNSIQNWNSDVVRNSLLAYRPVLVMGKGTRSNGQVVSHAFIVDGYLMCQKYVGNRSLSLDTNTKGLAQVYDMYFRANLGWGGNSDGYFLLNTNASLDFHTSSTLYRSINLRTVAHIRRK